MPSGDSGKIIRGSEFETEFDNIATAIATKADAADPTFTGTVTIDGLTVNGNTTLGNAATDTVTVTADIASNLIPSADDTYNLGASGAEWNDLYVDGTAYIDAIDFNGTAITATGTEINYLDITTLGTVEASKAVTADANGDVTFGDNDKAKFGAGSDLQIYHDGGNSRIYDQGTGALVMRSNQLNIQSPTGEKLAIFNQDNDVELYYDDSLKLATTNTGIDVTGSISADGLTVSSATDATITVADATLPTIQKLDLIHNAGSSTLISGNNGAYGSFTIQADDNANVINRFQINAGGDVSLYEDTGTTAKLFWDASAERLGLGTSSPSSILTVKENATNGIGADLRIVNDGSAAGSGQTASITIGREFDERNIKIKTVSSLDFGAKPELVITQNQNTSGSSHTEVMRIDSSGNFGIGTSSPATALHVQGSVQGGDQAIIESTNGGAASGPQLNLKRSSASPADNDPIGMLKFTGNNSASAEHEFARIAAVMNDVTDATEDGSLLFSTSSAGSISEAMRIDSSGHLIVPNGVTLGTAVGTYAAANTLDDYEEGTHETTATPETSGTITLESNTDTLSYTKVGRLVTVFGRITVDSVSSPVGDGVDITLPFSVASLSEDADFSAGAVAYFHPTNGHSLLPFVATPSLSNKLRIHVDASTIAASHQFRFMISYQTT